MRIYRSRFRSITPSKASSGPSGCGRWSAPLQLASALLLLVSTGCTALTNPIHGVPANRLPSQLFAKPKNNLVPIDISLLTLEPPRSYQLDSGDILGIYVEGVMPFVPLDKPPEPPPVNFPDASSLLPPSIGYPIPVAEDGTLSLPLLSPLNVRGLTLDQVREAIRRAYIEREIMPEDKARPVVTLIQERTYNVIVVRQDNVSSSLNGEIRGSSDESSSGKLVKLPAYQNDILHALVQTGGLPGLKAKNEVQVLRSSKADKIKRAQFVSEFYRHQAAAQCDPCACPPELPADPSILRIPLRLPPGVIPSLSNDDIRLEDGDIVYIESRETEVFYTGGLLPGGEHMLPRDYDLDVLGAIAITGGNIGGTSGGGGGGGGGGMRGGIGGFGGVPPGQLYILRETECDGQVIIEVDLNKAIMNPRSRPLIQAGDVLILQYKCEEEIVNFGLGTFFTYGIQQLLRN